ncbi:stage III sporulation protein AF [Clostridium weizhouense]|uniref:Stage III sporulation protein AF n=1 Tax=Clostridium weizhouense TaxID=2859781 RepID=A0ABS7AQJ9_9CLOT|nr:stage III sporulation protein AF [Clostridium weizhouense]MBW6410943.1 stage III sporulation protein AF [Clostridium weizhouense]
MDTLKGFAITLVTVLIFITSVELIAPNNSMKKYLKFILGLILITVILNPIVKVISKGEENLFLSISDYEDVLSKYDNKAKNSDSNIVENDNTDIREKTFKENFNKNCESLLKTEYPNKSFKCEVDCEANFADMSLDIKKLKIGVSDKKIKKINKINKIAIKENKDDEKESRKNDEYKEIVRFICGQLNLSKEKIEVYELEE